MKITELKCSACHGTLKVDENNPTIAICEYCQTKHVLEHESGGDVHLGAKPQQPPTRIEITETPSSFIVTPGRVIISVLLIASFLVYTTVSAINKKQDTSLSNTKIQTSSVNIGNTLPESETKLTLSGALAGMAEEAIGKSADSLTVEDLSRFAWIKVQTTMDYTRIGYSFDNPYSNNDATLTWLEYPRDDMKVEIKELSLFTGLKLLEIPGYLSSYKLDELNLEGITCYAKSPEDLLKCFDNAAELKEVNIQGGLENLNGLEQLKDVERLSVGGSDLKDITSLAGLKQLKSLTLVNSDNLADVSVLHVMTWLKELSIESEVVKDISFINKMPELEFFALYDAKILNLDSLEGNQTITSLTIEGCSDLKNLDAISGLTQLRHLNLEVPYNAAEPDLGTLSQLETMILSGTDTIGFLENMPNLVRLEISRCKIDKTSAFSGLQSLKTLKCKNIPGYESEWGFIAKIPSLEVLDLTGVATYKDVSVLFNISTLKELYLNGMECELNFSALQSNESLEVLAMDGVKLYKNVKISGGGGIVYVDYDKVTLDEQTDFLVNYPNLKNLSLAENKLSAIPFAEHLKSLETIDITENYVTDLKPLESLTNLHMVKCKGNPVENYRVLNEDILIIK